MYMQTVNTFKRFWKTAVQFTLTGRWWFWSLCLVQFFSDCVLLFQLDAPQSYYEPKSSEESPQCCTWHTVKTDRGTTANPWEWEEIQTDTNRSNKVSVGGKNTFLCPWPPSAWSPWCSCRQSYSPLELNGLLWVSLRLLHFPYDGCQFCEEKNKNKSIKIPSLFIISNKCKERLLEQSFAFWQMFTD